MLANSNLPEAAPQQKVISACACGFVPFVERVAKLVGVTYVGPQVMEDDTFHYFRDPVTGSSVGLWDLDLSVEALQESVKSCRVRFGVA